MKNIKSYNQTQITFEKSPVWRTSLKSKIKFSALFMLSCFVQILCLPVLVIRCKILDILLLLFLNAIIMVTTIQFSAITSVGIVGAPMRMATRFPAQP